MKLEYSGDFAQFDCEKCYHTTRIVIKNGIKDMYYCAYCGLQMVGWNK